MPIANWVRQPPALLNWELEIGNWKFLYLVTFAVCEPCFLNTRVGENSPSLWPTMFSVMKTELKVFPLCTKNVWPTKSGVTMERRDQVLIAFFAPDAFILSIFSRRCDSTKGPFFNDLAIICKGIVVRNSRIGTSGLACPIHDSRITHHDPFFFAFLLSKMNRSLGLCLLRVLNPFASCPHGLTG
jgi:hypothetical protein